MIRNIFIAPEHGASQHEVDSIQLKAGQGIIGDRNFGKSDYPGQNLTLIEAEMIAEFNQNFSQQTSLSDTRRNLITSGIRLNDLVGREFQIGDVRLLGIELCEPCAYLGELLANETICKKDVIKAFVHKGGLRVDVLTDGTISRGMEVTTNWIEIA